MLLGEIKIRFAKTLRLKAGINIAFESQNRLARIFRCELRMPVVKTFGV